MPTDPHKKDRIDVWTKKGTKRKLKQKAQKHGKSYSQFTSEAIEKAADQ